MSKLHYFGPGQAALPEEVLKQASEAVVDYNSEGLSILEIPHRGTLFEDILEESLSLVRKLCRLGDDFELLWMQGGGRTQFALVPMNLLQPGDTAGYCDTGTWAHEAMTYAGYYGKAEIITSSREQGYTRIPALPANLPAGLRYLHITTNNTIFGTQWDALPQTQVPLVADMSSDILSRELDYRACGLFYAVAQKNLGAAGNTLVGIRKEVLERMSKGIVPMMSYREHVAKNSVLNTPPVFAIYTSLLMLRWADHKGLPAIEQENAEKASMLYEELDRNPLFHCPVETASRSRMNVVFHARDKAAEQQFIAYCRERDICGIEGHRSAGAFRASLYNGVRKESVAVLVNALQDFSRDYRG